MNGVTLIANSKVIIIKHNPYKILIKIFFLKKKHKHFEQGG